MTVEEIRKQFPILEKKVYGKDLVYLDNAATTQRPLSVVEKWNEITLEANSNLHRAVHKLASDATAEYESTRDAVRDFLNAAYREEIIFTSGATASLNLLAYSFGEAFVGKGDEIIIAESEHHSDIVPWQMMCERKGAVIKVLPVTDRGLVDTEALKSLITDRTKLVCVAHISNVLGVINPVKEIVNICHSKNCLVSIDGAQAVAHALADVRGIGCDFYSFSGHKMYAAPFTGVLYGRKELLEQMPPYMGGGEMIQTVSFEKSTWAPLPQKFEAGTQNIAGVPTLKKAIETLKLLKDKEIEAEQKAITEYLYNALSQKEGVKMYGLPCSLEEKIPLFSFTVKGAHHEDLALILDKMGFAVRSGQMCAEPLMDRFSETGMVRISFGIYNTLQEAKKFMEALDRALQMLI